MRPFDLLMRTRFVSLIALLFVALFGQSPTASAQQNPAETKPSSDAAVSGTPSTPQNSGANSLGQPPNLDTLTPSAKLVKEDWSVLTVKMPPQYLPGPNDVINTAKMPDFTRELVQAHWRDNDPIDLYVMLPKGVKKPPVILYLYSYASKSAELYKNLDYDKYLIKYGFAAVAFESALAGDRYHDIAQTKWFVSELQRSLGTTVHDVQLVLNYLEKRGDMDMTRVGIFGDGSGATIAALAAAADPRIKAVDLLNPWGDWPDWLAQSAMISKEERPNFLKPEFLNSVENLDPVKWLPTLQNTKVRLEYIEKGIAVTPAAAMERVEAAAPPNAKIVHYETRQEFFQNVAMKGTSLDWIKEQLGAQIPTEATTTAKTP
jgi:hypothetical protein